MLAPLNPGGLTVATRSSSRQHGIPRNPSRKVARVRQLPLFAVCRAWLRPESMPAAKWVDALRHTDVLVDGHAGLVRGVHYDRGRRWGWRWQRGDQRLPGTSGLGL